MSVLVIDCTTIGAPPPTMTRPTFTPYVFLRTCLNAFASNPAIWFNICLYFSKAATPMSCLVGSLPMSQVTRKALQGRKDGSRDRH